MFIFPMAGLSQRFAKAGYEELKFMLPLGRASVFDAAVSSFRHYFSDREFIFILRANSQAESFLTERAAALGIRSAQTVVLASPTKGQADTVAQGLARLNIADDGPLTIFNIDTFRPGYLEPSGGWFRGCDGYLEVFQGSGANWSYVLPDDRRGPPIVSKTAEKSPISNLCCTGLYYFRKASDFRWAFAREVAAPTAAELFVAPVYNHLIKAGKTVCFEEIGPSEVVFCGIPSEYERLKDDGYDPMRS